MKKLISTLSMCMVLTLSTSLLAGSGSAIIPHFHSRYISSANYRIASAYISNVTDQSVTVTVTLYDEYGNLITDDGSDTTGDLMGSGVTSYNDNLSTASATFVIAANTTASFYIRPAVATTGYGYIEWEQNSLHKKAKALVAVVKHESFMASEDIQGHYAIVINSGNPF